VGPCNRPKTAIDELLREDADFEVDERIGDKLLLTCKPGGYLMRVH
jgi:cephalosporin hydroxylase